MSLLKYILLLSYLLMNGQTFAQWQTLTGTSKIQNNNIIDARERALKDALSKLHFPVTQLFSQQHNVVNGVLQNSTLALQKDLPLHNVDITNETITDEILEITVRVKTGYTPSACQTEHSFNVSIITGKASVKKPHQLLDNELFALPHIIPNLISRQLLDSFVNINVADIAFPPILSAQETQHLARAQKSQYVLQIFVDDISIQRTFAKKGYFWADDSARRSLALRFVVKDPINGANLVDQGYKFQTEWPFAVGQKVDMQSDMFSATEFAEEMHNVITVAANLIKERLRCLPLTGNVLKVKNNQVIIDLGSKNRVNIGQKFIYQPTGETLEVVKTSYKTATLQANNPLYVGNIQPKDTVVTYNM